MTPTYLSREFVDKAIAAHVAWRERLEQAIKTRGEGLQVAVVAADDRCDLGRMLANLPAVDDGPELQQLRAEHCRFHEHAGRIAQMACDGHVAAAMRALQGEYEVISSELVGMLRICTCTA